MSQNRSAVLALVGLLAGVTVVTTGCGLIQATPTPTIWYLVVTNTPPPTATQFVPASPTPLPTQPPTAVPPPTNPPPTPPPLPTSPPTRPPTLPPPRPTATPVPPSPTLPPTYTPVPTAVSACQGDEQMTFEPARPKVGDKLTIQVTSAKAHRNVRLTGPGVTDDPEVRKDGNNWLWVWTVTVPKAGRLDYTFYVENNVPCTANYCTAE